MGDSGREGVGRIIWFGLVFKTQMEAYHFFHLGFARGAVAAEGFFDLVGGVFVDWEAGLLGDEKHNATGLGDRDAGGDIFGEKEFFYGDDVWLGAGEDLLEGFVEFFEAARQGSANRGGDDAVV